MAVFLDRDGVINEALVRDGRPYAPTSLAELRILPEVPAACSRLRDLGFALFVVTNQPEVARGTLDWATLQMMHDRLRDELPLDGIYLCPHDDSDGCQCRKPAPGLILRAAAENGVDLSGSFMVGDRWRDVEAGRRAGCRTVFVDRGYQENGGPSPDMVADDLAEVAGLISRAVLDRREIRHG